MLFAHLSHAAQPTEEAKARQLWQLLDYIAVDYAGAVSGGAVVVCVVIVVLHSPQVAWHLFFTPFPTQ